MTTAHRDRRRANDLTCMTALGDVAAVLDRHRVDREADEIAFGAVVTTMRTLIASLVDLDPAVRAELAALVGELGDDASAVAAWTRFEDFVEHWFVLVRHVVFGLRPDAVPGELDRLRVDVYSIDVVQENTLARRTGQLPLAAWPLIQFLLVLCWASRNVLREIPIEQVLIRAKQERA